MTIGLEELTQEELISWVRENVPDLDEEEIVLNILIQRRDLIWEARDKWYNQFTDLNLQITQLVQKYADGPVKPGVKLRRWPIDAKREYERLDRMRNEAWLNYRVCSKRDIKTNDWIIELLKLRTNRITKSN